MGAEYDNRPEALLAAMGTAPAEVVVCDTVAGGIPDFYLPQEKRPFQPPFLVLFAVDDGVIGGIVDVHGLALGIGKPADIVKLIFVDASGLVHLEDRVLVAVRFVVLVTADVEVDIRFDDIDEGQRQRPGIGGVAGIVLCAELIDICACLVLYGFGYILGWFLSLLFLPFHRLAFPA